jgi:hypothetical protein
MNWQKTKTRIWDALFLVFFLAAVGYMIFH